MSLPQDPSNFEWHCTKCGAISIYADQGEYYCDKHWTEHLYGQDKNSRGPQEAAGRQLGSSNKRSDEWFDEEKPTPHFKRNKKRREPRPWPWRVCPFCHKELVCIDEKQMEWRHEKKYKQSCDCGAKGNFECPCCHRSTWHLNGVYKHQGSWGCGFVGEKKHESSG